MRKQESSLDSDDMIKRNRKVSFDADEELDIRDPIFFKGQLNPPAGKRIDEYYEDRKGMNER